MLGAGAKIQAMVGTAKAEAARAFYGGVLGLKLKSEDQFALVFELAGAPLRVNRVPAVVPSTYAILGFDVPDIAATVRTVTAAGALMERYPFLQQDGEGVWTAPDGTKVAWFRDPDGNLLSVVQHAV
ncbi:MAG: VOC family protein [Terricaulis silvestris]